MASSNEAERIRELQARIDASLSETPEMHIGSPFLRNVPGSSEYLTKQLAQAALQGGVQGIEAALDEYDRLLMEVDTLRMQRALMIFLTHHPDAANLGLRVPSLEERSPWKVLPSRRLPPDSGAREE